MPGHFLKSLPHHVCRRDFIRRYVVSELPTPAFKDERFLHGAQYCISKLDETRSPLLDRRDSCGAAAAGWLFRIPISILNVYESNSLNNHPGASRHPSCPGGAMGTLEPCRMFGVKMRTAFIILSLLFVTACASKAPAADKGPRTFKLGLIPGAQDFVDFVMENHGMLDQVGLKADKVKSLSPANLHLMVAERQVDIGFGGFTTMATARAEGKDIVVIYGVFSPVNMVFVPKNSSIHS